MVASFSFVDVERMISMKGMIIRSSSIIPEIREAIFRCLVCGYCSDPVLVERGNYTNLFLAIHEVSCYVFICNILLAILFFRPNS